MLTESDAGLPEFRCPVHSSQQLLSYVCLQPQCHQQGLLCRVCSMKHHVNHQVLPFKKLAKELINCQFKHCENPAAAAHLGNKEFFAAAMESVHAARVSMNKCFDNLEQYIKKRFEKNGENIKLVMSQPLSNQLQSKISKTDSLAKTNEKVSSIVKGFLQSFQNGAKIQGLLNSITGRIKGMQDQAGERLKALSTKIEQEIAAIQNAVNQRKQTKPVQVQQYWGSDRHPDIDIHGAKVIKQRTNTTDYVCATGQMALALGKGKVYQWRLKISSAGQYGVYFGIALQNVLRQKKFCKFDWNQAGHGHNVIYSAEPSSGNKSGSSFVSEYVVEMQFDTIKMVLMTIDKSMKNYQKVAEPPSGDCYRLVVYMWNKADCIEILRD